MCSINKVHKVSCDKDAIEILNSIYYGRDGYGCLSPVEIWDLGFFYVKVDDNYFNSLKDFSIDLLTKDIFNGCLPVIMKKANGESLLFWAYGYQVRFDELEILASGFNVKPKELKGSELKIACDLELLAKSLEQKYIELNKNNKNYKKPIYLRRKLS